MISPPARFCKLPLNAIPTATPADASNAANEVVFTPNALTTEISNRMVSRMLIKLRRKDWMVASIFLRSIIWATKRLMTEIRKRPAMNMTAARSILFPASTQKVITC